MNQAGDLLQVAAFLERQFRGRENGTATHNLGFNALVCSLLLQAFGTECLLKALWLVRGNKLASGGKYRPIRDGDKVVDQHDLDRLARLLDVKCTAEERVTLRRLTVFGEIGRFPIARNAAKERPEAAILDRGFPADWSGAEWSGADSRRARAVVKRLSALIYAEYHRK